MPTGRPAADPFGGPLRSGSVADTWLMPVRRGWPISVPLAWAWVTLEAVNGIGHSLWTLRQGSYTPGVATAPLLLVVAIYLAGELRRSGGARQYREG